MSPSEVFIWERPSIYRLPASASAIHEVSPYAVLLRGYLVKQGVQVEKSVARGAGAVVSSAQSSEVLCVEGSQVCEQLDYDAAGSLGTDGNVEENFGMFGHYKEKLY